jgi:hypothetical protein
VVSCQTKFPIDKKNVMLYSDVEGKDILPILKDNDNLMISTNKACVTL